MLSLLQSYAAIPLAALLVFVVLVAVARPDRDQGGNGLYAVYLSAVGITALYIVFVFGAMFLGSIAERLLVDFPTAREQGFDSFSSSGVPGGFANLLSGIGPAGDADGAVQSAVASGMVAAGAAAVLGFHLRRRSELLADEGFAGSAAERVDRAFLAAVAFVTVIVGITALGFAGYGVFRIVAPDVSGQLDTFESEQGLAQALAYGALVAACIVVFRRCFWSIRDGSEAEPS